MDVVLLLADSAQTDSNGGKVHALGIGWDQTSSPTAPAAVIALVKVPWSETNQKHHLTLQLRDADGHPVQLQTPIGEQAIQLDAEFEVGRPPGIVSGTIQTVKIAPTIGPMPLPPGRYEWHAEIDNSSQESWVAPFTVIAGPQTAEKS